MMMSDLENNMSESASAGGTQTGLRHTPPARNGWNNDLKCDVPDDVNRKMNPYFLETSSKHSSAELDCKSGSGSFPNSSILECKHAPENESAVKPPTGIYHQTQPQAGYFSSCFMGNTLVCDSPDDINNQRNAYFSETASKPLNAEFDAKCENAPFQKYSILESKLVSKIGSVMKKPMVTFTSMETQTTDCASTTKNVWFSNSFMEDEAEFKSIQKRNTSFHKSSLDSSTSEFENSPFPKRPQKPSKSSTTMPEFRYKLENSSKLLQDTDSTLQFDYTPETHRKLVQKTSDIKLLQDTTDSTLQFDYAPQTHRKPVQKTSDINPHLLKTTGKTAHDPSKPKFYEIKLKNGQIVEFVQQYAQRKYPSHTGPPPGYHGPPPPRGCEVFFGKVPRIIFEDELMLLFQSVGVLYEFRLIVDFSEATTKGFGFAKYTNKEDAKKAIDILDGYEIRPRRRIGVCKSNENCKLYIGGVPTKMTNAQVYEELCKYTEGISRVLLYPNLTDKSRNRGFAFVEYESHRAASQARRVLLSIEDPVRLFGKDNVKVDWAELEMEVDEQATSLYVRNIPARIGEEELKEIFSFNGRFLIQKVKKMKDFAFVHFFTREVAEKALNQFNGFKLDGNTIEVTWAKPRVKKCPTYEPGNYREESRLPLTYSVPKGLISSCALFDNPILLLHCICAEYGFGEPIYRVSQANADLPMINVTFTAQVSIPNWPFPVKQFVANGSLLSPYEAKQKVALCALKSVEFYKSVLDSCPLALTSPLLHTCNKETNQFTTEKKQVQPRRSNEHFELPDSSNYHPNVYSGPPVSDLDLLPTAVALANMFMN